MRNEGHLSRCFAGKNRSVTTAANQPGHNPDGDGDEDVGEEDVQPDLHRQRVHETGQATPAVAVVHSRIELLDFMTILL